MDNSVPIEDAARVSLLLQCINDGMTPSETAQILRKSASEIRKLADGFCDTYTIEDAAEAVQFGLDDIKKAQTNPADAARLAGGLYLLTWLAAAAVPAAGGALIGNAIGNQLGTATAATPPYNIKELRKLKQIQEYNKQTREILQRVRQSEEKANKKPETSVRQLF
jgi:hypothetical protein